MDDFFQLISTEAFRELFAPFQPLGSETLPLIRGLGRVLGEDIPAPADLPPFSRSTMDGFAVRARDTFGCSESEPALLTVIGEIPMGEAGTQLLLEDGQACRIWTGGALPGQADSVVMVEYTRELDSNTIEVFRPVAPGENIIRAGEDFAAASPVLSRGQRLRPQDLGVLAGLGIQTIKVVRQPRVAIISTGDELVPPGEPLPAGKIYDINTTTLAALIAEAGGKAISCGIVPDDLDTLLAACNQAMEQSDMVLLSGGSSVGRRDFTLQVFQAVHNAEILAHGVAIRPGKPTILARRGNIPLLGLPGHAASAMVVFYLFVRPLIRLLTSGQADLGMTVIQAVTAQPIPSAIGREEYVRVRLAWNQTDEMPTATPVYGRSGLLRPLVTGDGMLIIGRDSEGYDQGAPASVLLFPMTANC